MGLKWPTWSHAMAGASLSDALFWPRPWQTCCLFVLFLAATLVGWVTVLESPPLGRVRSWQTNAFEPKTIRNSQRSWDSLAVIAPVASELSHWATRKTPTDTVLQFSGAPAVVHELILRLAAVGVISSYALKGALPLLHQATELKAELHMTDAWVAWTPEQASEFMQPLGLTGGQVNAPRFVRHAVEPKRPPVAPLRIEGLRLLATVSGPSGAYAVIQGPEGLLRVRAGDLVGSTGARVTAITGQHVQLAQGVILQWR